MTHASSSNPNRSFEFTQLIGRGAYGEVYLAEQLSESGFRKKVAIKVLHRRLEQNDEAAMRMRDEARILGHLQHRHIINVIDLIQIDERWAIVMDYMPGEDLDELIADQRLKHSYIPIDVALHIATAIFSALDAAYTCPNSSGNPMRVIHRDIKPSNVRLTRDGQVKIMDFGVARVNMESREAQTTTDAVMGTLAYLAPERVTLDGDGPEGDIYAGCATLVEMLNGHAMGRTPVLEDRHGVFIENHLSTIQDRLSKAEVELPSLITLLRRGLHAQPSERPSASELTASLRALTLQVSGNGLLAFTQENITEQSISLSRNPDSITMGVHQETSDGGDSSESTYLVDETAPPQEPSDHPTLLPLPRSSLHGRSLIFGVLSLITVGFLCIVPVGLIAFPWSNILPTSLSGSASTETPLPQPEIKIPVGEGLEIDEPEDPAQPKVTSAEPIDSQPPQTSQPTTATTPAPPSSPETLPVADPPDEDSEALAPDPDPAYETLESSPETINATSSVGTESDKGTNEPPTEVDEEPVTPSLLPDIPDVLGTWAGSVGGRPTSLHIQTQNQTDLSGIVVLVQGTTSRSIPVTGTIEPPKLVLRGEGISLITSIDGNRMQGQWIWTTAKGNRTQKLTLKQR